jgi:hypothetical protein
MGVFCLFIPRMPKTADSLAVENGFEPSTPMVRGTVLAQMDTA